MPSTYVRTLGTLEEYLILLALPFLVLMRIKPLSVSKLCLDCLYEALVVFEKLRHKVFLHRDGIPLNELLEMIILNLVVQ